MKQTNKQSKDLIASSNPLLLEMKIIFFSKNFTISINRIEMNRYIMSCYAYSMSVITANECKQYLNNIYPNEIQFWFCLQTKSDVSRLLIKPTQEFEFNFYFMQFATFIISSICVIFTVHTFHCIIY